MYKRQVEADTTELASTPAASRTAQATAAPTNNEAVLKDFVDALIARIDAGEAGQVDFPARFTHVTEVEHALRTLRALFERAGATNSLSLIHI